MRKSRNRQIMKALFKYAPRVKITISKEELRQAFQSSEALEELIERKYEEARDAIYGKWEDVSRRLLDAYTAPYGGRGYPGDCVMFEEVDDDGTTPEH